MQIQNRTEPVFQRLLFLENYHFRHRFINNKPEKQSYYSFTPHAPFP
jgi:hypothetical protein